MYFRAVGASEKVWCKFWNLNDQEKGMANAFSEKRLINQLCVVDLEIKLERNRCACSINN